jgi:hypothetical protein
VPTDGYIAPTDHDRIVNGADYTKASATGPSPGPTTVGAVKVVHP